VQNGRIKLSEEMSKLPPQVQERLLRYQQIQQTLQTILAQKQQVDIELTEIEQALNEMQKTADDAAIYKSIGTLLVKTDKTKVTTDLTERKELLNTRATVLGKQEERLRTQMKDLQAKLQQDLSPASPS
jgi:prefoldin beta subunit